MTNGKLELTCRPTIPPVREMDPIEPLVFFVGKSDRFEWSLHVTPCSYCDDDEPSQLIFSIHCKKLKDPVDYEWTVFSDTSLILNGINEQEVIDFTPQKLVFRYQPSNFAVENSVIEGTLHVELIMLVDDTFRKFDDPTASDVVLVVGEEKFHLSKWFLCSHSDYFTGLFGHNFAESDQQEVNLHELHPYHFHSFLEVLLGEPAINDRNVSEILKIMDYIQAPTVFRACEKFLVEETKKPDDELVEIAERWHMDQLMVSGAC
ncbi:unnamed protein product [Caenorhabditis brenneri]